MIRTIFINNDNEVNTYQININELKGEPLEYSQEEKAKIRKKIILSLPTQEKLKHTKNIH